MRGDDVEYGIRAAAGFITINGICVWHMGFAGKMNIAMDFYQVNRNLLIVQALHEDLCNVNVLGKIRNDFNMFMNII